VKFIEPSYKTEATTYKYLGYQPKGSYRKKLEFGRKRNWKKYQGLDAALRVKGYTYTLL